MQNGAESKENTINKRLNSIHFIPPGDQGCRDYSSDGEGRGGTGPQPHSPHTRTFHVSLQGSCSPRTRAGDATAATLPYTHTNVPRYLTGGGAVPEREQVMPQPLPSHTPTQMSHVISPGEVQSQNESRWCHSRYPPIHPHKCPTLSHRGRCSPRTRAGDRPSCPTGTGPRQPSPQARSPDRAEQRRPSDAASLRGTAHTQHRVLEAGP